MAAKILFFDIDGTLVGYGPEGPVIPQRAAEAIRNTRRRGNLAWLCTGRTGAEIGGEIRELGFDGIIAAGGGDIRMGDELLLRRCLPEETVEKLAARLEEAGDCFYLETDTRLYCNAVTRTWLEKIGMGPDYVQQFADLTGSDRTAVDRITFYTDASRWEAMTRGLEEACRVTKTVWAGESSVRGEITVKGIDKGTAIRQVLERLGIPEGDAYGFGDSMGDREMFDACGTAVAMGNSSEETRLMADYVTGAWQEDGLAKAMEHFGLAAVADEKSWN